MDRDSLNLLRRVIGAIFEVSNSPGAGFLERVYERALMPGACVTGIRAVSQAPFSVVYKGQCVGEYLADICVEEALVVELGKKVPEIVHVAYGRHCAEGVEVKIFGVQVAERLLVEWTNRFGSTAARA